MKKTLKKQNSTDKPQDEQYWVDRKKNDKEHDWLDDSVNWIYGYAQSVDHPHRTLILDALKEMKFGSLLEVGCNSGPNLMNIQRDFPVAKLAGFDLNAEAIKVAKKVLKNKVSLGVGTVRYIPWQDKTFDVVLCDAVLMYVQPKDVAQVMAELERVARKAIIIVDRFATEDSVCGHVWGRNYTKLLKDMGYKVEVKKITKAQWPTSKNWQKYGRIFVAHR